MKNTLSTYFVSDAKVNKTWFKGELLYNYKQYGIQEHTDERYVVLIIPKGMKSIVQNACFSSVYIRSHTNGWCCKAASL